MLFELTKEITAGRRNGEIERIDDYDDFFVAEQAMLMYADEDLPNGIDQNGDTMERDGCPIYTFDDKIKPETWNVGDRTGMACGDYTLWITKVK